MALFLEGKYDRYLTAIGDVVITNPTGSDMIRRGESANLTTWQINSGVKIKF